MKESREILFLKPVFAHNIWGGTRLRKEFKYDVEGSDIGECWGIAAHSNGDCTIENGEFKGQKLSAVYKNQPELFGNLPYEVFPLLVKIIDAQSNLSIQVHPDDEYARLHENGSFGKTECWYVLDCPENAQLVIGHNASDAAELESMVSNGKWDKLIRKIPVFKGDFIQINPGTVHAITAGCMILETQQNSDITYRLYDYDRLSNGKPRELHIKKCLDVINVPEKKPEEMVAHMAESGNSEMTELIDCKYYKVFRIKVFGILTIRQDYSFLNMSVIEGKGKINDYSVEKGNHFIVPNQYGEIELMGNMEIIASTAK